MIPQDLRYCSCFCEENVWHLCQHSLFADSQKQVMFISNQHNQCAIWQQKASGHPNWPILWDYHVVLVAKQSQHWCVFDLDSRLPFGVLLSEYLAQSFGHQDPTVSPHLQAQFKLIHSEDYIKGFRSDRGHMVDEQGQWLSPEPDWPLINGDGSLDLASLRNFSDSSRQVILSLDGLQSSMDK